MDISDRNYVREAGILAHALITCYADIPMSIIGSDNKSQLLDVLLRS